jgi:hypothetical protein
MTDMINNPPHYTSHPSGIEAIEITRHMNFNLGNAIKYIWRAGQKDDAIQDLETAMFYIADEIRKLGGAPSMIEKHKIYAFIRELTLTPEPDEVDSYVHANDLMEYLEEDMEPMK